MEVLHHQHSSAVCCHAACAGNPSYSVGLMPSNTFVLEMAANSTGPWSYYCNILDHINAGMKARMVVS
jgi:FtsP/CotA-like multicopper oxidase with cupredoxin domain